MTTCHNSPHWSDDDLLGRLYGLDPAPERSLSHLETCPECSARRQALELRRAAILAAPGAHDDSLDQLLRRQRQAVWQRIEHPHRTLFWRAVPATATALLVLAGILLVEPRPVAPVTHAGATISDAEFFTEVASAVNEDVPRAADPMRGLFDTSTSSNAREAQ